EKGRGIEALDHYIKAVQIAPNSPLARIDLALLLTRLGNRGAAIQELREFVRNRQDDPQAHSDLGNGLIVLGEYDEAVVALRAALQLDPDLFEAHRDL